MKRFGGDSIVIKALKVGNGGLLMYGDNTIENARKTIDESNKRRIKDGWIKEPERYAICCHEWYRYVEDDGTLIKTEDIVNVIEKYPAD